MYIKFWIVVDYNKYMKHAWNIIYIQANMVKYILYIYIKKKSDIIIPEKVSKCGHLYKNRLINSIILPLKQHPFFINQKVKQDCTKLYNRMSF